jgi:hypothetical protein
MLCLLFPQDLCQYKKLIALSLKITLLPELTGRLTLLGTKPTAACTEPTLTGYQDDRNRHSPRYQADLFKV